jgi:leader peptidase (prepilin peptidase)/N-methyltransferase
MESNLILIGKVIGVCLVGWIGAGIINYFSDSLPQSAKLTTPVCKSCSAQQSFVDILLLRQCSFCHNYPSLRSWLVLISIPLLLEYIYFFSPSLLGFGVSSLLILFFAIVFVIDVEHREIYTVISIIGGIICLSCGWRLHGISRTLWGGVAGYAIMLALYWMGIGFNRVLGKIRKMEINEVALGYGDVTLSGALGLVLGFPGIAYALLIAILLGGVFAGVMLVIGKIRNKYQPFTAMPYAPFLLLSAFILLFIV